MKTLVILGGLRVGDCWHMIPVFNKLKNEGYAIDWVTGTYEKHVAECLKMIYKIDKLDIYDDGFPTDINSRKDFFEKYSKKYDYKNYDKVVDNYKSTFEFEPEWKVKEEETYLPSEYRHHNGKNIIVVQPDSISSIKRVDSLFHCYFPYPVISIGGREERIIPGSTPMLGMPWIEVLKTICSAKLYVGIHSAVTCLAFYTGIPMIVVDYGDNFKFDRFHKNIIQLIQRPSIEQIQEAIDGFPI